MKAPALAIYAVDDSSDELYRCSAQRVSRRSRERSGRSSSTARITGSSSAIAPSVSRRFGSFSASSRCYRSRRARPHELLRGKRLRDARDLGIGEAERFRLPEDRRVGDAGLSLRMHDPDRAVVDDRLRRAIDPIEIVVRVDLHEDDIAARRAASATTRCSSARSTCATSVASSMCQSHTFAPGFTSSLSMSCFGASSSFLRHFAAASSPSVSETSRSAR